MADFAAPVVATHGSADPTAPLIVLLHGRGSNEQEILELAKHLPPGPAYAAVRAPIAEGGGFAWFANRGIGRPVPESLRTTMSWFREWLDAVAPTGRPVVLIGFSGGAAFAGGLILDQPERYVGAGILYGTVPFDAGVPVTAARLAGLPVFVAHGDQDAVIPRDLLDRTWAYLTGESGAPTYAATDPGGHGISAQTLSWLGGWLHERLAFLAARGEAVNPAPQWTGLPGGVLPQRRGPRAAVNVFIPQSQTTQQAPVVLQEKLFGRVVQLEGVTARPSAISVPGARAFTLIGATGPVDAFIVASAGEFAHLHPAHDGSLHVALPLPLASDAIAKGWAVAHPLAGIRVTPGMVLVFGPRDDEELDIVTSVVATSHGWASGTLN